MATRRKKPILEKTSNMSEAEVKETTPMEEVAEESTQVEVTTEPVIEELETEEEVIPVEEARPDPAPAAPIAAPAPAPVPPKKTEFIRKPRNTPRFSQVKK